VRREVERRRGGVCGVGKNFDAALGRRDSGIPESPSKLLRPNV
jgi:hypothetical protein